MIGAVIAVLMVGGGVVDLLILADPDPILWVETLRDPEEPISDPYGSKG
jgi:hypothetical protein